MRANLEELREEDKPDEPMASQMWQLLHLNYPMGMLVSTLQLLKETSWTTLPCEQLHGSLAVFRR